MCDKAVDAYMLTPTLFPDWFVTSKVLKTWDTEYDYCNSDDDSVTNSGDYSDYIKIFQLFSWLNKYNQHKEYKNNVKNVIKIDKEFVKKLILKILIC